MVVPEGDTRDLLADLGHQVVYDIIEEVRSRHVALSDPVINREQVRVPHVYPHTPLRYNSGVGDSGWISQRVEEPGSDWLQQGYVVGRMHVQQGRKLKPHTRGVNNVLNFKGPHEMGRQLLRVTLKLARPFMLDGTQGLESNGGQQLASFLWKI